MALHLEYTFLLLLNQVEFSRDEAKTLFVFKHYNNRGIKDLNLIKKELHKLINEINSSVLKRIYLRLVKKDLAENIYETIIENKTKLLEIINRFNILYNLIIETNGNLMIMRQRSEQLCDELTNRKNGLEIHLNISKKNLLQKERELSKILNECEAETRHIQNSTAVLKKTTRYYNIGIIATTVAFALLSEKGSEFIARVPMDHLQNAKDKLVSALTDKQKKQIQQAEIKRDFLIDTAKEEREKKRALEKEEDQIYFELRKAQEECGIQKMKANVFDHVIKSTCHFQSMFRQLQAHMDEIVNIYETHHCSSSSKMPQDIRDRKLLAEQMTTILKEAQVVYDQFELKEISFSIIYSDQG